MNLCRPEERAFNAYYRRKARYVALLREVLELMVDEIHPSHLGMLPPKPKVLVNKALRHKVITHDEYNNIWDLL